MSRRVYLHIGTEKTGTSSIQHFFAKKRDELKKLGILYPASLGTPNNMKITAAAENYIKLDDLRIKYELRNPKQIDQFRKNIIENLKEEIEESNAETVIISNEHLSSRLNRPEEIERVKKMLSPLFDEFKIVVYLRRQDKFFESRYSTAMKTGNTREFKIPEKGKESFDFHYWNMLQMWEAVYGKENMIVRKFEKEALIGGDIIKDFVNATGIDIDIKDEDIEKQNVSLGAKKIEFLKYLNEYLPRISDNKLNISRGGIVKLLESVEIEDSPLRLPRKERKKFLSRFTEENLKVAEYYFGNRRLFSNEIATGKEKKPQKLSVKETFLLFAKLWEMQQHKILSMQDKQKELHTRIKELNEKTRELKYENALMKNNLRAIGIYSPVSFGGGKINDGIEKGSIILKEGFYHKEGWGIWTNGNKISEFLIIIDKSLIDNETRLIMDIEHRYLKDSDTVSYISINDGEYKPLYPEKIELSPDILKQYGRLIKIKLKHENPASPASLGLNPKDNRIMGCGLKSILFKQ